MVVCADAGPIVSVECTDSHVFSTSFDGTCRVWDWEGKAVSTLDAHDGHASGLALYDDEAKVITGGDDGFVKVWDVATEANITSAHGHTQGAVWCVRHHSHVVLSCSTDGAMRLWDARNGLDKPIFAVDKGHADAIAGAQMDRDKIVTSGFDSCVHIWDLKRFGSYLSHVVGHPDRMCKRATMCAPPNTRCTRLAYDDTRVITGSLNGTIVCFDMI